MEAGNGNKKKENPEERTTYRTKNCVTSAPIIPSKRGLNLGPFGLRPAPLVATPSGRRGPPIPLLRGLRGRLQRISVTHCGRPTAPGKVPDCVLPKSNLGAHSRQTRGTIETPHRNLERLTACAPCRLWSPKHLTNIGDPPVDRSPVGRDTSLHQCVTFRGSKTCFFGSGVSVIVTIACVRMLRHFTKTFGGGSRAHVGV